MTMGGKGPEVLVTLTTDFGKILSGLHDTKIKGGSHLTTGIQVAGVCLILFILLLVHAKISYYSYKYSGSRYADLSLLCYSLH